MGRPPLQRSERVDLIFEWGERLREARVARGLTQVALAELIGTSQAALGRWENSYVRPEVEWQAALASTLEYSVAELFPRSEAEARPVRPIGR